MWMCYETESREGREHHVAPWCDDEPHWLDRYCFCRPRVAPLGPRAVEVIHNSYDGREEDERKINALTRRGNH